MVDAIMKPLENNNDIPTTSLQQMIAAPPVALTQGFNQLSSTPSTPTPSTPSTPSDTTATIKTEFPNADIVN